MSSYSLTFNMYNQVYNRIECPSGYYCQVWEYPVLSMNPIVIKDFVNDHIVCIAVLQPQPQFMAMKDFQHNTHKLILYYYCYVLCHAALKSSLKYSDASLFPKPQTHTTIYYYSDFKSSPSYIFRRFGLV